tara:strand:- start:798 stop:908 length:111 start_codon:yes stop_codon:yes gene_type:complete
MINTITGLSHARENAREVLGNQGVRRYMRATGMVIR